MLRQARQWLVSRLDQAALSCAPRISPRALDRIEPLIAWCGPRMPVLGRLAAENMVSAGLYSPAVHREYFANVGAHLAGALQALHCAGRAANKGGELGAVAAAHIDLDESLEKLADAAAGGRGAILVGPHISNYLLNLTRLNQAVPLTVYLRQSKDPVRQQAKQCWYRASGVNWMSGPTGRGSSLGRLGGMSAALRAGRVLFITPDLAKKRTEGVPVRLLGRKVYLPGGAAALAVRTGAPLFALHARKDGPRQCLFLRGPFEPSRHASDGHLCRNPDRVSGRRGPAAGHDPSIPRRYVADSPWRTPALLSDDPSIPRALDPSRPRHAPALMDAMQWFADQFERFLREQPALWYLWADKRWTRVFRGDPKYVAAASAQ